jgi:hypothetical protein
MNIKLFLKGEYTAKLVLAKLLFPFNPNKNEQYPYAIQLTGKNSESSWDLNSFRPDIRDFPEVMEKLKNGINLTVLYENLFVIEGKKTKIPRYIIYNEKDKEAKYFVNVR